MNTPGLGRNYLYTIVLQMVSMLTPLVTAPYVARALGSDGVGAFSFVQSVATVFSLFAALGLSAYGLREVSRLRDDPDAVSRLFWELTLLRFAATLVTLLLYAFLWAWVEDGRLYGAMSLLILATGLDLTWFFQAMERFGTLMLRHLAVKAAGVVLVFALVRDGEDVAVYALIQTGTTLLSHLLLWPYLRGRVRWERGNPLAHLRPSLVYFVPAVATSVYTVLDKAMLGLLAGDLAQNGYYESAHKIVRLLLSALTSLNLVVGVRTSYLFGQNRADEVREHLHNTYRLMCALAFPLWGGLMACGGDFTVAFFGSDFADAGGMLVLFSPLLFLIGTSNVLGSLYLTPAGYRGLSNRAIVMGAAVNLALNLVFIPRFGGYGAVAASVAAEGVIAGLYLRFTHPFLSAWRLLRVAGRYALYGVAVFAAAYAATRRWSLWAGIAVGIGFYAALLILLRDPVWQVWRKLRGGDGK